MKTTTKFLLIALTTLATGCAGWHPRGNFIPRIDQNAKGFNRIEFDRAVDQCIPYMEKTGNDEFSWAEAFVGSAAGGLVGGLAVSGMDLNAKGYPVKPGDYNINTMVSSTKHMSWCLQQKGYRILGPN